MTGISTQNKKLHHSLAPFFAVMIVTVVFFLIVMYLVDRSAVKKHEADFNDQQRLQVLLVKQSMQAGIDKLIAHCQMMTSLFTRGYDSKNIDSTKTTSGAALVFAIDRSILGYAFLTPDGKMQCSRFPEKQKLDTFQRLIQMGAEKSLRHFHNPKVKYYVPFIHATPSAQLMGVVTPVRLKNGKLQGILVIITNLRPMLDAYISPMRSGQFGAGYLLDENGVIVYDHEEEIIGRNVFDGMHNKYPDLLAVDHRLVSEPSGESSYTFTVQRGGDVSRKLIAWHAVTVGDKKLVVCLSAPDIEINAALNILNLYHTLLGSALGIALILMSVGIFQRRKALEAARNEEMFRRFTEASWEGIISHKDGVIYEGNDQLWKMFGYDLEHDEKPTDIWTLISSECHDDVRTRIENNNLATYETIGRRNDGTTIPISIRARNVHYNRGLLRLVAIRDITDRKHAEAEMKSFNLKLEQLVDERTQDLEDKNIALENANQRLKDIDQAKSAFLSSVSHELRTPLTSILGFTKLIERDFNNISSEISYESKVKTKQNRIRENICVIIQEGNRLTRLINDVLDLARIEGGRQQWNDQTFPLAEVMKDAARTISPLFTNSAVNLLVDVEDNLPEIHMDRDCLYQVIFNLLDNAIKFTNVGEVVVSASEMNNNGIRIKVRDTGPGLPENEQNLIFDKFYQLKDNDTIQEKPVGTGLGLNICKKIIEHYNGSIRVESVLGKGSTFIIDLPKSIIAQ